MVIQGGCKSIAFAKLAQHLPNLREIDRICYGPFVTAPFVLVWLKSGDPAGNPDINVYRFPGPLSDVELGPLDKPFVAAAVVLTETFSKDGSLLQKEVRSFVNVFGESSQQVAKGRGQRRFADPTAAAEVMKTLQDPAAASVNTLAHQLVLVLWPLTARACQQGPRQR